VDNGPAATASLPTPTSSAPRRRSWSPFGVLLRLICLALILGVLVFTVSATMVVQHGRTDPAKSADAIVVLGAAQYDGRPGPYLLPRLEHALELYRRGVAKHIVTVGGNKPGDRFTEAGAGREWLVERGVPADDVVAVEQGSNTLQSLQAARPVLADHAWRSAFVVTDRWHELRSTTMLNDQGVTSFGAPTTVGPSVASPAGDAKYVLREAAGYLAYRVQRALP
jgi:uncharacterized SAM-binding protein YcdF (DUF218 family)